MEFLVRLIEFINDRFKYLVTGLLFEFEDMFPYEGRLRQAASPKAYSRQQIESLVRLCKKNQLKIAVLV